MPAPIRFVCREAPVLDKKDLLLFELVVVPFTLVAAAWLLGRSGWRLLAASLILSSVCAYGAYSAAGTGLWTVVAAAFGAFAGPGVAVVMGGRGFAKTIVSAVISRYGDDEER